MDYEWKIKVLDRELAHLKEIQELERNRLDIGSRRLDLVQEVCLQNSTQIGQLTVTVQTLATKFDLLPTKIDQLIDVMLGNRSNGH